MDDPFKFSIEEPELDAIGLIRLEGGAFLQFHHGPVALAPRRFGAPLLLDSYTVVTPPGDDDDDNEEGRLAYTTWLTLIEPCGIGGCTRVKHDANESHRRIDDNGNIHYWLQSD